MWFGAVGRVRFSVLLISLFILNVKGNDFAFTQLTYPVKCGHEKVILPEEYNRFALEGCKMLKHEEDYPDQCSHHADCFPNRQKKVDSPKPYDDGHLRNQGQNLYLIKIPSEKNFQRTTYNVIFSWNGNIQSCQTKGVTYNTRYRKGNPVCLELRPDNPFTQVHRRALKRIRPID